MLIFVCLGEGVPGLWNLFTNTWPQQLTTTGKYAVSVLQSLTEDELVC